MMNPAVKYRGSENRLILLDYDGTLVSFIDDPHGSMLPGRLHRTIKKLASDRRSRVMIVTGRDRQNAEKILGNLPVDIIADHGAIVRHNNSWKTNVPGIKPYSMKVLPILHQFTLECRGSSLEIKPFSLSWHYRKVDPLCGYFYSRELIRALENSAYKNEIRILDGKKTVDILHAGIDKGTAIKKVLDEPGYDFILCIGDDATDEDMFGTLCRHENAITIKVGYGRTTAKYRIDSPDDVVSLLESL